jgi:hypothetical protein
MLLSLLLLTRPALAADPEGAPELHQPRAFTIVMPFGTPQYVMGRPKAGLAFTGAQLAGFGFGTFASVRMWQAFEAEDYEAERSWRMASWGGIASGSAAYFGSVMHGSRLYQLQGEQMAASATSWQTQQALGPPR